MNTSSLRADGWQDAVALLVSSMAIVFIWYVNDLHLNWIVVVVGSGAGLIAYHAFNFIENIEDDSAVAAFPITMAWVIAMLAALQIPSLVVGVVAAVTVTTALKLYEVYW